MELILGLRQKRKTIINLSIEMWDKKDKDLSGRWDWKKLRKCVVNKGVRNSLL